MNDVQHRTFPSTLAWLLLASTRAGRLAARRALSTTVAAWVILIVARGWAADPAPTARGDALLADYFARETAKIENTCLTPVPSRTAWEAERPERLAQLKEMLGLDPLPERTPLEATVTRQVERDGIVVESLHFQSRPQLYVTANLYRPREVREKLPAVLYVCGHGGVKLNGVSYGNKVHYQHHGVWFAQHGYVCMIIDSLQLGEIEAIHHGTYRYGMWWWLNRGYTPAGVEAWNCIRSLDYLESRPEVDGKRLGVTGRSGGGAYSWWIAALDERIRAAVPVAGITDLENHVVDGCVEGHCDCMYFVNTYRWDYPQLAAMVAPRPLLIANTDRDGIFPLDGVVRTYNKVRDIYELSKSGPLLGLNITAGPHKDTQELQMHAFRWFDEHLRGAPRLIDKGAAPLFEPDELRVLAALPADQKNTTIHDTFVPAAAPPMPSDASHWATLRDGWLQSLAKKSFAGWPAEPDDLNVSQAFQAEVDGVRLSAWDFTSQTPYRLRLYVAHRAGLAQPDLTVLNVLDANGWKDFVDEYGVPFADPLRAEVAQRAAEQPADKPAPKETADSDEANSSGFAQTKKMFQAFPWAMAYVAPRGIGPTAWNPSERKQIQNRRRFYLLGQSLEGMQVWDARRAIQAVRKTDVGTSPLWLQANREMGGVALYASLFEPAIKRIDLHALPTSHRDGPVLLNVQRYLDLPQAATMAAERSQVVLYQEDSPAWDYPKQTARKLQWSPKQFQIRKPAE